LFTASPKKNLEKWKMSSPPAVEPAFILSQMRALLPLDVEDVTSANDAARVEAACLIWDLRIRLRLRQQYARYPKRKINYPAELPEVLFHYQKGLPVAGAESDFDKIGIGLRQSDLSLGIAGNSHFQITWNKFLNSDYLPFMDYQHINGNQTFWIAADRLHTAFRLLPYYTYSTADQALEIHYEHNFRGFIFDKLPLLRKTGLYLLGGAGYLYTPDRGHYQEYYLGLDRLGFGILRILRLDVVAGRGKTDTQWNYGWRISLSRGG